jgi:hypothetical protein
MIIGPLLCVDRKSLFFLSSDFSDMIPVWVFLRYNYPGLLTIIQLKSDNYAFHLFISIFYNTSVEPQSLIIVLFLQWGPFFIYTGVIRQVL